MLVHKVGLVAVEPVGDEDRNIILPGIARRGREQKPVIRLYDFEERLGPGAIPHHPLFIKDKEGVLDVNVLTNVVPGVDDHFVFVVVGLRSGGEQERSQIALPFTGVPFSCSGDDVEVSGILHRNILVRTHFAALLHIVISEAGPGLPRTNPAAEDTAVFHPIQSFELVVI